MVHRVDVIVHACPSDCSAPQPADFAPPWLTEPAGAVFPDERTAYTETTDAEGQWVVELTRFIASEPGGPLDTQLGIYATSPGDDTDDVRRTLDDILTQTS
ncbi:hypothetical protein DW322_10900 [Rhodococcus rhodnii]|uniref:SRPBCC family protein n=1 Tax=Rhodococcus rhodnii TaxID=38312 RepID=A0A6P2CI26_9NOCA|nr:hypothetical protein DW322_10900 [Rhodococcus rhodnii]